MGFWIKTLKNIKHRFYASYECFNGKVTKNDFIKEKQVTEATGNLTQLKQEKKTKQWLLSKHNQSLLSTLHSICILHYVIVDNKVGMLWKKFYIKRQPPKF